MATTSAVKAGKAYVELGVDSKLLAKGLNAAARKLQAFGAAVRQIGTRMAGLGTAVLAPLLATTRVFGAMGDELAKMSVRTGISVEALSELAFAADQSGADLATLEAGVRKMQRTLLDAADGSQTAQDALAILGLTVQELAKLSPEQQFKLLADRLSQIQDPTLKAALAMELFGKSGTTLLPLMQNGARGMEELQEQARSLGLTISGEDARAAEVFSDALDALWKVLKRGIFTIGSAIAPMLTDLATWFTRVAVGAGEWLKRNRELVVTLFKVAAAVVAGGVALVGLGFAISGVGAAFAVMAKIVTGVGAAIGFLGTVLAALVSPIGLVITAVAALGAYLIYSTDVGAKALSWLGAKFTLLKDTALQAYQGIADALAAGDIGLAARILWLTLKLAWDNGVAALQQVWLTFSGWFVKVGYGAFYGVLSASEFVWHAMKVVWIEGVAFLRKLWGNFVSWHAQAVEGTANAMVKSWIWAREKTGAITEEQAAFERDYVQKQHEQAKRQIENDRRAAITDAERQRDAARSAESQRHEARLADIGKRYNDAAAAVDAERAEKTRKTEAALAQARKEWQDAIAEARRKRQAKEAEDGGPPKLGAAPAIEDLSAKLTGLADLLNEKAKATVGVSGTFNALEARGLGAGGVTDRIASATEATAKNTKKLADKARNGGLAFE